MLSLLTISLTGLLVTNHLTTSRTAHSSMASQGTSLTMKCEFNSRNQIQAICKSKVNVVAIKKTCNTNRRISITRTMPEAIIRSRMRLLTGKIKNTRLTFLRKLSKNLATKPGIQKLFNFCVSRDP